MKKYQVTIGYRAIINVNVKANNETEAKQKAIDKFSNKRGIMNTNGIELIDDNFKADGVLDVDATWGMYDK